MSRHTNWPPNLSTNMVIDLCTLNIQSCMIPFCVRSNTLIKMVYHLSLYDKCTIGWSKFWKSAQIMPIRLNVAYFWPTWRKELEFWTSPSNWVCPAHMKICFLCSKGQKFNVLDFDKNWFATQFLCVNSIFEVFMMKSFQKNEKNWILSFLHLCSTVFY